MKKTYLPDDLSFYDDEESNDALQKTIEDDIAYYKANPKYPPKAEFSEDYEKKLKATLERFLGDDEAEQVLAAREDKNLHVLTEEECLQNVQEYEEMLKEFEIKKGKARRRKSFKVAAAACIGIVLLTSGVFGMKSNALKIPIGRFFEIEESEYVVLEADNDSEEYPTTIEQKFIPSKVLDGYTESARDEWPNAIYIAYSGINKTDYRFAQETIDMATWFDSEDAEYKKYSTTFGDAYYSEKNGIYALSWHYEGYVFTISGELSKDEMIELANSLRLQNED